MARLRAYQPLLHTVRQGGDLTSAQVLRINHSLGVSSAFARDRAAETALCRALASPDVNACIWSFSSDSSCAAAPVSTLGVIMVNAL